MVSRFLRSFGLLVALAAPMGWGSEEITVTRLATEKPQVLAGRVSGPINAPVERVWEILNDFNRYAEFLPRHLKCWVLDPQAVTEVALPSGLKPAQAEARLKSYRSSEVDADTVYTYNLLDLPLPIGQRWYVLAVVRDPSRYQLSWHQVAGNLVATTGSWRLREQGDRTIATYTTFSDVGFPVPGFLITLGLKQTLPDVIRALRRRAEG